MKIHFLPSRLFLLLFAVSCIIPHASLLNQDRLQSGSFVKSKRLSCSSKGEFQRKKRWSIYQFGKLEPLCIFR